MKYFDLLIVFGHLLAGLQVVWAKWTSETIWVTTYEGPVVGNGFLDQMDSDNPLTVRYAISGADANKFSINSATGELYQVVPLDRETKSYNKIIISAYDAVGVKTEFDRVFGILVMDINDNKPVFVQDSLKGEIKEAHGKGLTSDVFMIVNATDRDIGFHAKIAYAIVPNSDTPSSITGDRFAIDKNTGEVRLMGDLDYEQDTKVSFKVTATDRGGAVSGNTVTAVVTVTVQDSNDMAPVFVPMPPVALSELSPLNKPCYEIYASDGDEGVNKKVYFAIIAGNVGGTFTIDSWPSASGKSLGQLQLLKELDYEDGPKSYKLTIKAYNKEADNHDDDTYSQTSVLKVTVIDENDAPIFRNTPYSAIVTEGPSPIYPSLVILDQAEDTDFNGNQTVTYSMNDPKRWFWIDTISGQVYRTGAVDREASGVVNGVYILRVVATDNYNPPASSSVVVEITINDINDNSPIPDLGSEGEVNVCEKPRNRTVAVIKTTDPDSPANGPKFFYKFDESVDTTQWGFKEIDDERQEVVANFSDYGLSSDSETVPLVFTITDSGSRPQTTTPTLTVTVCKCDVDDHCVVVDGFNMTIIIAIIGASILLLAVLIFVVVLYKRRQPAKALKKCNVDDEDGVKTTAQVHRDEGIEEYEDTHDVSALRRPLMEDSTQAVREEIPLQQARRQPVTEPTDDATNIIGEEEDRADEDPSPPSPCWSDNQSISSADMSFLDSKIQQ